MTSLSRILQAVPLAVDTQVALDTQSSHHLARVLRAKIGDTVTIFNGNGGEYQATIVSIDKKTVHVRVQCFVNRDTESPLSLCLAQGISRGEKMDFTIQKAVELGVNQIVPLLTERCNVKLDEARQQKRLQHWQAIIVSACEQSGRNTIPTILPPQSLTQWLPSIKADHCFVLAPNAQQKIREFTLPKNARVVLCIGPEGGLSEMEIQQVCGQGFTPLNLGPRILRTETAGIAALTALQCYFGDLGY